ncbi:MAG: hypothetical protein Q9195_004785 [Heterodermia aff. obscurata]
MKVWLYTIVLGIPGGFQPKNTLTTSDKLCQHSNNEETPPSQLGQGIRPGLELETSIGNNVRRAPLSIDRSGEYGIPLPKRRKLAPQTSEANDNHQSSDGVDPRCLGGEVEMSLSRESQRSSQAASSVSQRKDASRPTVSGCVQEYQNVEARMNSDPPKTSHVKRPFDTFQAQGPSPNHSTIRLRGSASSISNPIDLCDDEVSNVTDLGVTSRLSDQDTRKSCVSVDETADDHAHAPQRSRDSGEQSHHFAKSAFAAKTENSLLKAQSSDTLGTLDSHTQITEPRLNEQFRAMDGKRRNAEYSSSPDELAISPETVQFQIAPKLMRAETTPPSLSSAKSSSSTRKASTARVVLNGLAPSSVPISAFKHSAPSKCKSRNANRQANVTGESKPHWGIQLAAVNVRGTMLRAPNLGLQFNPRTASYEIINGGRNLATDDGSLQIQPHKLRKAMFSTSGSKIRFLSSKSAHCDPVLDIELHSEKDCQELLTRLQSEFALDVNVDCKDRDYLDKAFQKRLLEQMESDVVMRNRAVDEGEDVKLAAYNKANRKPTQGISEVEDTVNTKKRRPGRISNQMKSAHDGNTASSQGSSGPGGMLDIYNSHEIAEDGASQSTMSEITRSLQPKKQSGHVTRSRMLTHLGTGNLNPPVSDQTRIPKISHVRELGEPWRKPLVYPKDGKKKSTVEWTDLDRLGEGEFFNDTLISFYLRYLEHKLEERNAEMAKRVYLFNSFFYASLTKPQKGKKGINYEAVQKWTRGVDIFNCDYVIVPINESLHWYFAVICNLPALHRDLSNLDEDRFSSPLPGTSPFSRQHQEHELYYLPPDTASLHADDTATQHRRPTQATAVSTEEDARSSFADLSLDHGDELIDQGILEAQSTCERVEASASSEQALQIEAIIGERMTVVDASAEPESPIAASSKKRKRKSLPPGKRLDPTEPAIVTFDSLAVAHAPTVRTLKDYLKAEAHSKRSMAFDDGQLKGMTAVGIPKQDNYCDCGPYLLGYMDKFLQDPKDFMEKTMRKQLDPEKDWPQLDPSNLRLSILDLIVKLHNQQENERKAIGRKDGKAKPLQKQEARPSPDRVFIVEQDVTTTLSPTPTVKAELTLSDTYQTRNEALQHALMVDEVENAAVTVPHISQTMSEHGVPSLDESQSLNHIDVSPVQSRPVFQRSNVASSEAQVPEDSQIILPSTIQDSQPQDSFQFLEELQPDSTESLLQQLDPLPSISSDASPAKEGTIDRPQGAELMGLTPPTSKVQSKHHFFVQID